MTQPNGPLRIGIGGPVGSGKTTLTEKLCKALREEFSIAVVTNDIYTREDAMMLARLQGAAGGAHRRRRDRRLPAYRHPRGRLDQSAGDRGAQPQIPRSRHHLHRIRRRQPCRHLLAGSRRPHALCHLRLPGRGDPAERRSGDHPFRFPDHQQERPGALCERQSRRDGERRRPHARQTAVWLHRPVARQGVAGGDRFHRRAWRLEGRGRRKHGGVSRLHQPKPVAGTSRARHCS